MAPETGHCALRVFSQYKKVHVASQPNGVANAYPKTLPPPSKRRRTDSLAERPLNLESPIVQQEEALGHRDTVLYLAYGSNLCAEIFQGKRGIRPLSQVNVVVPELVMTFDLAGLPYVEPCFGNTKYRDTESPSPPSEKSNLLSDPPPKYHKNRWKKGLVGVVYEVTPEDYAHIIATEGGGASYQDVLVQCYELPAHEDIVPEHPTSQPFKAHTLYSPVFPPGEKPPQEGGRFSRPDPNYAQASSRYLKLISDGADEHGLPEEYKEYLHQLRPYTVTTQRQKLGRAIFMMTWLPFISFIFKLSSMIADEDGRVPPWFVAVTGAVFKGMWVSYDGFFYGLFGDGERTIYKGGGDEDGGDRKVKRRLGRGYGGVNEKTPNVSQVV